MLLKDWIQTKTRSITPLTEWPLLYRTAPSSFTSRVFPCCWDPVSSLRSLAQSWGFPGTWARARHRPGTWARGRVRVTARERGCGRVRVTAQAARWAAALPMEVPYSGSSASQGTSAPPVCRLSPDFQSFVISRIHYCKHLTFVSVICWGEGAQEGEFCWSSSLP